MNETLNANEALNYGLISKITNNNMENQAKEICRKISTFSSQVSYQFKDDSSRRQCDLYINSE